MTEQEFKIKVLSLTRNVFPLAKRMLVSEVMARDAVQQGMLKLWENRKQLDECDNIKAFVFKVIRNVCLDEIKKKKPHLVDDFSRRSEHLVHHDEQHEKNEAFEIIQKIITQLPANQREVILMRDIDGLEFDEIAMITGGDIPYIRVLLSRARKTVKEKLEKIYAYEAIRPQ